VTFALYSEQQGGAPLWQATQNVAADAGGRFAVLLGADQPEGLPLDLFTSNEARWLGVRLNGPDTVEEPRVLLVAVPYVVKAAEAETLGGNPLSAFMLAPDVVTARVVAAGGLASTRLDGANAFSLSGTGTTNSLVKWTDGAAGTLGDATGMFAVGGALG